MSNDVGLKLFCEHENATVIELARSLVDMPLNQKAEKSLNRRVQELALNVISQIQKGDLATINSCKVDDLHCLFSLIQEEGGFRRIFGKSKTEVLLSELFKTWREVRYNRAAPLFIDQMKKLTQKPSSERVIQLDQLVRYSNSRPFRVQFLNAIKKMFQKNPEILNERNFSLNPKLHKEIFRYCDSPSVLLKKHN